MVDQRLRRWPTMKSTFGLCLVFAVIACIRNHIYIYSVLCCDHGNAGYNMSSNSLEMGAPSYYHQKFLNND